MPSSQRASSFVFPATLLCRSRDFVKSSAERAHRWTGDAHRARGIAWTLFMRRERGPRLDMELVDGSDKGVARGKERDEDEAGVSHFIHGGCLKLGSQCSLRCFPIVIRSCVHDLRSREPLQKTTLHSVKFCRELVTDSCEHDGARRTSHRDLRNHRVSLWQTFSLPTAAGI